MKRRKTLTDFPSHLRGLSNNKYGGHTASNLRAYGRDWNRRFPCRTYSQEEKRALEEQYRKYGSLVFSRRKQE